jgi:DUF917 family protein
MYRTDRQILAGVPDLIAVLDNQSGAALGTPDFKYGLRVLIIGESRLSSPALKHWS